MDVSCSCNYLKHETSMTKIIIKMNKVTIILIMRFHAKI